jgi:hypothetical protein
MPSRPSLPARLSLVALAGALILITAAYAASPRDRRFFSVRHGVGVDSPPGWSLSQHTGYASILVALLHPDGSRISISAATTPAPDARALVEQNRRGLEAQHLAITRLAPGARGGMQVDARATDRNEVVRQLYLVRAVGDDGRQAVVITLVTRPDHLASAAPGLDWVVAHLVLEPLAGHEDESPDARRP